jgi:hypothetical protein
MRVHFTFQQTNFQFVIPVNPWIIEEERFEDCICSEIEVIIIFFEIDLHFVIT